MGHYELAVLDLIGSAKDAGGDRPHRAYDELASASSRLEHLREALPIDDVIMRRALRLAVRAIDEARREV